MNTRSIADTILDTAGNLLREAKFPSDVMSNEELLQALRYLEDCHEEGQPLYPEILITTELTQCLQTVRPQKIVICGNALEKEARIKRALKKCAPLAVDGWTVVIEVTQNKLEYGILASGGPASSLTLLEQLRDAATSGGMPPFLFLRRHGNKAIFLTSVGDPTVISLTLSHDLLRAEDDRTKFAQAVVEKMPPEQQMATRRSVLRMIARACREGHGVLAAVIDLQKSSIEAVQKKLSDGSFLSPPLEFLPPDLQSLTATAAVEVEAQYGLNLALARRMLECDLMVLFSNDGKLLGFNIFVPDSKAPEGISGGARTRAYHTVKTIDFVEVAFMSSQDGQTYYHTKSNA